MTTSTIRKVRDLMPLKPLSIIESMRIADIQAIRLLSLLGIKEAPVPEAALAGLPRIHIERLTPAPFSGAAQWTKGRWLIVVNGSESTGTQRIAIGHELKHILDAPFSDFLYPAQHGFSTHDRWEEICDYFAVSLFMPSQWVKKVFVDEGVRDLTRIARRFDVPVRSMQLRLASLGLVDAPERCGSKFLVPA
jgi:Zn-dependent peptidase ImmA (M78 family)